MKTFFLLCRLLTVENENLEKGKYQAHQEKLNDQWASVRDLLLEVAVENGGIPPNQVCVLCDYEPACLRCLECGPYQFFCKPCGINLHKDRNHFHYMEHWVVCIAKASFFMCAFFTYILISTA